MPGFLCGAKRWLRLSARFIPMASEVPFSPVLRTEALMFSTKSWSRSSCLRVYHCYPSQIFKRGRRLSRRTKIGVVTKKIWVFSVSLLFAQAASSRWREWDEFCDWHTQSANQASWTVARKNAGCPLCSCCHHQQVGDLQPLAVIK